MLKIFRRKSKKKKSVAYKKRGVVLLVSVTVASLVLAIGIGILNIITKEIILSTASQNSRIAFFAADSGIECAMHWDMVNVIEEKRGLSGNYPFSFFPATLASSTYFNTDDFTVSRFNPFCAGQTAVYMFDSVPGWLPAGANRSNQDGSKYISRFFFYPGGDTSDVKNSCAFVQITKEIVSGKVQTSILSEGFSSCDNNDTRRASRGIKVQYLSQI
ncbi:MAG: hypothetical protein KAR24_02550 [Candidatus Pacebacteria bacterium]|nr:hypothetical protein [Candidatus Paceibacterota bacterium]